MAGVAHSEWKWLNILRFFRSIFVAHFYSILKTDPIKQEKNSRSDWSLIFRIMALSSSSSFPNVSFDYITCWVTVDISSNSDGTYHNEKKLWTLLTESSGLRPACDWTPGSRLPGICMELPTRAETGDWESRKRRVPTMGIQRSEHRGEINK